MRYEEMVPSLPLRSYATSVWRLSSGGIPARSPSPMRIMPEGRVELLLNLAGVVTATAADGRTVVFPGRAVMGQMRRAMALARSGPAECFGVHLRPTAAASFFGVPAAELTGLVVDLADLAPRLERSLGEWTERHAMGPDAVAALGRVLLEHAAQGARRRDHVAEGAALAIVRSGGAIRVSSLASECSLSARQFERRFEREVGLSPKLFSRLVRFNNVCKTVERARPEDWGAVAAEHGYADQAHLIRDFRAFAGESPTRVYTDEVYALAQAEPGRP